MSPETHIALAVSALKEGERDKAAASVRDLLRDRPALGDRWGSIARIAAAIGEIDFADQALTLYVAARPEDPSRSITRAAALAEAGRVGAAVELMEGLARSSARNPQVSHLLGSLYSQLGRFDDAREQFERALSVWPLSGHSWLGLAAIHRYSAEDPELKRLQAQRVEMLGATVGARAAYNFALGKALDDAGVVEDAFASFSEGAALARSIRVYDRNGDARQAAELMSGWTRQALTELGSEPAANSAKPIFVTGIPRSGTTLIEQLLVSHPEVDDGGEINIFPHVVHLVGGARIAAARAYSATASSPQRWFKAAELYQHLLDQRLPSRGRVVDKSLTSSRALGLISIVLPEAPLLWVRRDPLDVAWSCFRTMFARGVDWSWALADIAHHMRLEDMLLAHWSDVLGDRLLVIQYESLVADPERESAKIFAHCGLAEAPAALSENKDRVINTASLAQVRQPIYQSSVGAAAPYRKHLEPFLRAYHSQRPPDTNFIS